MTDKILAVSRIAQDISIFALDPPAWTRLEPLSLTGDPRPGLETRVHDALWMLGRQWQFGEFQGEDAGSPTGVLVEADARPVTAWRPGGGADNAARAVPKDAPLDPFVEMEAPRDKGPGLRQRAEAGALLVTALSEGGLDARAALLAACPLPASEPVAQGDAEFWKPAPLFVTLARGAPDGQIAAKALEAGTPPWLAGASAAAKAAAADWLAWYRANVDPPQTVAPSSWLDERLEYRFAIRAGSPSDGVVLEAPLHLGGVIDWHDFDYNANRADVSIPGEASDVGAPVKTSKTMLPTPLTYAGMPSDRLWQFEDGNVNFGMLNVQAHDPARLCLVEFATIFGNDWFLAPFDVATDTLTEISKVVYSNTFGEEISIAAASDGQRAARFRLFEFSKFDKPADTRAGLLVAPTARGTLQGRALEEVQFLRDENANMCWALEKIVQVQSGDPRSRRDEKPEPPLKRADDPDLIDAELWYRLQTQVPAYWVPLVPVPTSNRGGFILRKGTTTGAEPAYGWLLHGRPFDLKDEELPREGVAVRRIAELALGREGVTHRWIGRQVSVGRGEGSSGIASDSADSVTPPPS